MSKIDWSTVFDQAWPVRGARKTDLTRLLDDLKRPLTEDEIEDAEPHDASSWQIPNRPLPESYLDLLRWSNGGEFLTGERRFQILATSDVRDHLLAYGLPEWMPGALCFAWNGGGKVYCFDMRQPAVDGEYPIVCASAGDLGWPPEAGAFVANSLLEACRGRVSVEDLLYP